MNCQLADTIIEAFDGDYGGCECPIDDFIQQVVKAEEQAMTLNAVDVDEEEEDDG
jgi:hypothetical protein